MAASEADIENAIMAVVDAGGLSWPIVWPNASQSGLPAKPYISVQLVRVNRRDDTLNGENTISLGRVVGTMVVERGTYTQASNDKADQFAALFPMGKTISVTGGRIVFTKPADILEGSTDGVDWRVSVIAQYECSSNPS